MNLNYQLRAMTPMDNSKKNRNSAMKIARFDSATNTPIVYKRSEVRSRSKSDLKNPWALTAVKEMRRSSMNGLIKPPSTEISEHVRT